MGVRAPRCSSVVGSARSPTSHASLSAFLDRTRILSLRLVACCRWPANPHAVPIRMSNVLGLLAYFKWPLAIRCHCGSLYMGGMSLTVSSSSHSVFAHAFRTIRFMAAVPSSSRSVVPSPVLTLPNFFGSVLHFVLLRRHTVPFSSVSVHFHEEMSPPRWSVRHTLPLPYCPRGFPPDCDDYPHVHEVLWIKVVSD